jgi:hypothetical protein
VVKFKVGDLVIVNDEYPDLESRGKTGVVVETLHHVEYPYGVQMDHDNAVPVWGFYEKELSPRGGPW